jgi:hypothetical protein
MDKVLSELSEKININDNLNWAEKELKKIS